MEKITKYWKIILAICLGAAVVLAIFFKVSIDRKKTREAEINNTVKKLEALAKNKDNLSEIEKQIQEMDDATRETRSVEESMASDNILKLNERFTGSVVVGDSLTEGLVAYKILGNDKVVYKRGVSIKNTLPLLQTAVGLNPSNVFMAFGMNDIEAYQADIASFIQTYKEKIEYVRQNLPNAKIFVNNIQPATEKVVKKRMDFSRVPQYNEALENMCEELAITFIDNQSILEEHPEFYAQDGIHVSISYYPLWLENMAKKAGI